MEYFAASNKLSKILNDPNLMLKQFGPKRSRKIMERLNEFDSAKNLSFIPSEPPPRCHRLHGSLEGKFAVDVSRNFRLIFEGYDKFDLLSYDKEEIVSIRIIEISDYH